jgi:putative selenium-binding protein YdfZ
MKTYDRNRNAITTGSRVMISDTGLTGRITAIDTDGLTAEQIRRGKTVEIEGCEGKYAPRADSFRHELIGVNARKHSAIWPLKARWRHKT